VKGLTFKNVEFAFQGKDERPPLVAYDVDGFTLDGFKSQSPAAGVDALRLEKIKNLTVRNSPGLADRKAVTVEKSRE